jgi:hypothetical protein
MHKNVNAALISAFRQAIDPEIISDVETDPNVHQITDFINYFDQFMRQYGRTDALVTEKLLEDMKTPWDPTTMDMAKLICQIRDGMSYAQYIGQPITLAAALQMAELLILKSGHMKTKYSNWKTLPAQDRNWTNFCLWWKEKHAIWKTTHISASEYGYGGTAEAQATEETIDAINAQVNAANAATFQNLSQQVRLLQQQNAQLQAQAANNVQQQPQVQQPIMQQPIIQPIMQPPIYQQPYLPPQQFIVPQVQQQPYVQQPQPFNQQYTGGHGRGYGGRGYGRNNYGRGGNCGYGRGGCGNGGRGNYQGNYQGNQGYQQQYGNQENNGGFYGNVKNTMNPVKRHNNMWYCWTHGYDVDHHSGNCMDPHPGHQWNATRTNTMGGCHQAKKHKTILPSNNNAGANGMYYM